MKKIIFKNGQSPYMSDIGLNQMQDNIEDAINELETKTEKILDVTDSKYNIQTRVFKNGKIVQVIFYCLEWGEALENGQVNYALAQLPAGARPTENIIHKVRGATYAGKEFSVMVTPVGGILIFYNYSSISAKQNVQIAESFTFIAQ